MKCLWVGYAINGVAVFFAAISSNLIAASQYGNAVQFENIETSTSTVIHGSCGKAFITISGVDTDNPTKDGGLDGNLNSSALNTSNPYAGSQVEVTVLVGQPGKSKQKSTTISLEEASIIHCINTKTGRMVVIGTECRGNVEGCYSPNYFVINAEKITKIDTKKECDTRCANQKLGGNYLKARE
jgi:hypothetical protein